MYMMFVDESGDPGYPSKGGWKSWGGSRLYGRVGAIIHGRKWKAWNSRLNTFKKNRGLTWDSEVKASHIRRGDGPFVGRNKKMRDQFLSELLSLIGTNADITLLGVTIDKPLVQTAGSRSKRIIQPEIRSLEFLLERYNSFLHEQEDKNGIVILDPVQGANDDNIRYFQQYLQAHSGHLQPLHIVEGTFFAKSHTSNMIQVADICSNVLYRREARKPGADEEFKAIYPRFWRHNSRVKGYGLKRWPEKKKSPRK